MTEWNEGRLDDLSNRVDRIEKKMDTGFSHVDQRFKETDQKIEAGFARMDTKFDKIDEKFDEFFFRMDAKFDVVNERFENLHQMLFRSAWALVIGLLGMFSVLIGVIVAQS